MGSFNQRNFFNQIELKTVHFFLLIESKVQREKESRITTAQRQSGESGSITFALGFSSTDQFTQTPLQPSRGDQCINNFIFLKSR